ncbi:MAG: hypothetical protein IJR08_02170 [Bacilli bacterium]|nr:hypothetical protein [Bacilli bacterium]
MKKEIAGIISSIVLLLLLCSGAFANIIRFFAWLFTLQYSAPETSIAGGIIVRVLTFLISYGLVDVLFTALGWFNSKVMRIVYFIVSTLIAFALAYLVWTIETYIMVIGIVMGIIMTGIIIFFVVNYILSKKKKAGKKDE